MTGKIPEPIPARQHKVFTEMERSAAITMLAVSGYDFTGTAEKIGVSIGTLKSWNKDDRNNRSIPSMIEGAIKQLLNSMPTEWTGNTWAVALGILMDKWLLLRGDPTVRSESIIHSIIDGMPGMTEDDKAEIVRQAEYILEESKASDDESKMIEEKIAEAKRMEDKYAARVIDQTGIIEAEFNDDGLPELPGEETTI